MYLSVGACIYLYVLCMYVTGVCPTFQTNSHAWATLCPTTCNQLHPQAPASKIRPAWTEKPGSSTKGLVFLKKSREPVKTHRRWHMFSCMFSTFQNKYNQCLHASFMGSSRLIVDNTKMASMVVLPKALYPSAWTLGQESGPAPHIGKTAPFEAVLLQAAGRPALAVQTSWPHAHWANRLHIGPTVLDTGMLHADARARQNYKPQQEA